MALLLGRLVRARTGRRRRISPAIESAGLNCSGSSSLFGFRQSRRWYRFTNQFMPRIELVGYSVFWSVFAVGLDLSGRLDATEGLSRFGNLSPDCHRLEGVGFRYGRSFDPLSNPVLPCTCGAVLIAVSFLYHRFSERLAAERSARRSPSRHFQRGAHRKRSGMKPGP